MDSHIYLCQKINHKQMQSITIAKGDGIGPEIMDATLKIIKAVGTQLEFDEIKVGEKVIKKNIPGIDSENNSIRGIIPNTFH